MLREVDQIAVKSAHDEEVLSEFVKQYEFFILKVASKTARKFVSKSDDEWSIALIAFNEAIKKYDYDKGSFIAFAELIIHQNLVDYYRMQGRHSGELHLEWIEDEVSVDFNDNNLKLEIEAIAQVLNGYDFSFMDLVGCSPKAVKTKSACAKAITYLLDKPELVSKMHISKQLPIKAIKQGTGIPRKILERHRKYIIAAVEILLGDYPYLAEYLSCIKEVSVI